jgi:hypothetical protein
LSNESLLRIFQGKQGADLKIGGGYIDFIGYLAPVVKVAENLPFLIAVIYNKKFASRRADSRWNLNSPIIFLK